MINVDFLKQFRNGHFIRPKADKKFFTYGDGPTERDFQERDEPSLDFSRSFIDKIIRYYWDAVCSLKKIYLPLRETNLSFSPLSYEENRLALKIGTLAGNMDAIEAGYFISSIYTKIMPSQRRASLGVFYTPPAIVNRLIDNVTDAAFDWEKGKILDPACGGGAFLAPLALRLLKGFERKSFARAIEDIEQRLKGYEIDEFAAWMSMVFLDVVLLDVYKVVKRKLKNIVDVQNTLISAVGNKESFDLIIGNPPYGKIFLQPHLRRFYARSLYGHANLYGLFIDAALRLANPGASIAFVTSTSYLGGKYFKSLRKLLMEEAPPLLMDFIEDRKGVFDEVLQETMITLFQKKRPTGGSYRHINVNVIRSGEKEASVTVKRVGKFVLDARGSEPWITPRDKFHLAFFANIKRMKNRLENLGYTVITGQLVWNRHKNQLSDELYPNTYPLIWAESIINGNDETFQFNYSKRNHKPFFKLENSQEYLLTKETCLLSQRTTAKEQKRRIAAAILPGDFIKKYNGVVVENHLNIIKPINQMAKPAVSLEVLKRILNSRALDIVFRSINGSVAVSAYEIKSLPMPGPDQVRLLEKMVKEKVSRDRIEDKLTEIYGVRDGII